MQAFRKIRTTGIINIKAQSSQQNQSGFDKVAFGKCFYDCKSIKLMMSFLVAITVLFSTVSLFANPEYEVRKIVVLIGLEDPDSILPWKQVNRIAIQEFKKAFSNLIYDLVIIPNATQVELSYYLNDPYTVGLFYISHAAGGSLINLNSGKSPTGVKKNSIIVDSEGHDVLEVFGKRSRGLKLLALVGCQTTQAFRDITNNSSSPQSEQLTIISFDKKMELNSAIKKAIHQSKNILENEVLSEQNNFFDEDNYSDSVTVRFSRKALKSSSLTSLQIKVNNQFIQVVPGINVSEEPLTYDQTLFLQIPKKILKEKNKILISSGYSMLTDEQKMQNSVGLYELQLDTPNWELSKFIIPGESNLSRDHEEIFYLNAR